MTLAPLTFLSWTQVSSKKAVWDQEWQLHHVSVFWLLIYTDLQAHSATSARSQFKCDNEKCDWNALFQEIEQEPNSIPPCFYDDKNVPPNPSAALAGTHSLWCSRQTSWSHRCVTEAPLWSHGCVRGYFWKLPQAVAQGAAGHLIGQHMLNPLTLSADLFNACNLSFLSV